MGEKDFLTMLLNTLEAKRTAHSHHPELGVLKAPGSCSVSPFSVLYLPLEEPELM